MAIVNIDYPVVILATGVFMMSNNMITVRIDYPFGNTGDQCVYDIKPYGHSEN